MEGKLQSTLGNWVSKENFFGRENELRSLTEKIGEGAHILLVAQRRMGKTSILKELASRLADQYLCLYVDLQMADDPEGAIVEMAAELWNQQAISDKVRHLWSDGKRLLGWIFQSVEQFAEINVSSSELRLAMRGDLTKANWQAKGDDFFSMLAQSNLHVILMLDELPILVNRMLMRDGHAVTSECRKQADAFMSWLRKNSQKHQGRIRTILSGSIGLHPVLRRANLSATINHAVPFDLEPWDKKTAVACLEALAANYGIRLEDGAAETMIEKLGYCIPYHVQLLFDHARDMCGRRDDKCFRIDEVEALYKKMIAPQRAHAELSHYEERLKNAFSPKIFALAQALLSEAALGKGALTPEKIEIIAANHPDAQDAREEILQTLEHDGYLKQTARGYVFVSGLVKDWWKATHRLGYISVDKGLTA